MVKFLPFAVVIFTILCFACVLNALEDNLASSNGNSSKDTAEAVSPTSTNRPSSGRVRSSAWSKEEKAGLKTEGDMNDEEDMSLLDDESSLWNMKNLFRYVVSLLYDVNQSSDGSENKALDNLQIKMQNLGNNYLSEKSDNNMKGEMRNSANTDTMDKSLDEVKMQNRPNNDPLNNGQLIKNSKIKTQNLPNTDTLNKSEDDRETQNSAYNNNTSSKSSNDEKAQKSSNTDFIENKEATGNSKSKMQSPVDNDSANKPEDSKKTEKQSPDTLTKPASDGYKQNSAIGTLNESLSNGEMQKSSNNNTPESAQLTETSKSNQPSSVIKNHFNELVQNSKNNKTQNPSSESLQLESVSALINDKPKEEVAKIIFKDYDGSTDNTSDEEVDESEDDTEEEEEDEDEMDDDAEEEEDEDNMDDNETKDDNMNDTINKNDSKDKDSTDDNINENANNDGRKYGTGNKNPPAEVVVDTKANDPSIKLPKFIIKAMQNQRNFSEAQPSKILLDSNNNVAHEGAESHNITNEGNPISEFQLSSNEFIDDYINTPQGKTPEKRNEQSSNADLLIPDETYSKSKIIPMQIPISKNNSEEDNRFLYATPSANENAKDRNIPFNQPQNTVDNALWDINASPFPNESKRDSNPNKDIVNEFFTENVKNEPTSAGKPIIPGKLFPFQEKSYSDDLQNTFAIPQENYNVFTKPATLNFQNTDLSDRTPHNDIPATHIYRSEVPYQTFPYKPIPIGNEGYANDPYEQFNFQDEKYPSINNEKNPQFEQHQPIILQQDALPNSQHISDQSPSIIPEETTYFTNYSPEMPVTIQNTGNSNQNMEMFPNNLPFDALQTNPSFSEIYNQDSSPTGVESSVDTFMSPDHLETAKPENQINIQRKTNFQNQLDNLPFQDNFPQQQALFPETDVKKPFVESEMHNKALPRRSNMNSEIFLPYDESKNTEFQQSQPDTNNAKGFPRNSFTNTQKIQINPKNQESTPVTLKNTETNSPVKSSKPLIYEHQKRLNFNESVVQEQETSSFDSDFIYNGSSEDHGRDYDEDESEEYATRSHETDTEQSEGESNFASENKYEFEDSEEEDYYSDTNDEDYYSDEIDEDDYADENEKDDYSDENDADDYADENGEDDNSDESNEDDYAEENNYGGEETKSDGKAKKSKSMITPDKRTHDNTITSPKPIKQATSNKQNHGKTQPSKSQINNNDDVILENSQSHSSPNEGNSSPGSESINGGFNDNYTKDHLDAKPKKENKRMKPAGTTNDVTQFITPKSPSNEGDGATGPQETSNGQNKSVSSKQGENVNTILEYIYKHSNSPLFKGVRDENES